MICSSASIELPYYFVLLFHILFRSDAAAAGLRDEEGAGSSGAVGAAADHRIGGRDASGTDDANADVSEALINKLDEVKQQQQQMTQFDVKIGAGMDIAIHGENGE